ncbi:MAG: VCBS repeat-containing protein [Chitinophagaceae bacterium]
MKSRKNISFVSLLICSSFLFACHQSDKLFISLSSSETNITFANNLEKKKAFGILYYLYYYNGGGTATGDINNDGLPDIYFTANSKGHNKLYLNKGNFQFEDITDKAGVQGNEDWCSGVTMADVNGDGLLDIYVCAINIEGRLQGKNELFINNGNGTFKESATEYGLDFSGYSGQAAFFDYDHDGDLDCFLLNQSHNPNGNIVDTSHRRKTDPNSGARLFQSNISVGQKKFTDVSLQAGIYESNLGYGLGLAIADLNNDGWDDIYVGNDFHENDYYYVNNGNGTFTESGASHFNHYSRFSMGNDIADYNNDGQPDVVTVDMLPPDEKILKTYGSDENPETYNYKITRNGFQYQVSRNCLQRNNGSGTSFSDVGLISGISATDWSWSPLFADLDNDGNKDLFISSGIVKRPVDLDYVRFVSDLSVRKNLDKTDKYDDMAIEKMPDGASHPFLFKGDGQLGFKDVSNNWGTGEMKGYYNGASYADLDNDGNLDIVINCINAPAVILKNKAPRKNYLSVSFKGDGLNTMGVGAKTWLFEKDKSGNQKLQYQQLMLTRGFQSSSDSRLHFGLDSVATIDSVLVVWPDQKFQVVKNIAANKAIFFSQKDASGVFDYKNFFATPSTEFIDVTSQVIAPWRHTENAFSDFNNQYLIPHEESTRGPKIAVGDVNKDGLDDFYACGAAGQAGALMVQQKDGSFTSADTSVFNHDRQCEDVDATFFDANGDGYTDLYVVSGGNEYSGNNELLLDRLYLNDGKGHFTKSNDALPSLFINKSCVSIADIDHDGDNDIFIGGLADPNAYGIPQNSYLLINDGKAHFSLANNNTINLSSIGIVTSAAFADFNKDGWLDLAVAGEWMPLTIFINHNGKFEKKTIANSGGLWQNLFIDDVNKDGNPDILAGNWGLNSKLSSGKDGPLKLYVADFDGNHRVDQLLSYTVNGIEYPFLAKDEVERQLPLLKKHYLLYADYAGVPMKDVFYGWIDTIKPFVADHLTSSVCYGDGKGGFVLNDLPGDLQLSPLFSFQKASTTSATEDLYIAGGNFFGVTPYEGRYDAQALGLFSANASKAIRFIQQPSLSQVKGEVRDLKWLNTIKNGRLLLVARNNLPLLFFKLNK